MSNITKGLALAGLIAASFALQSGNFRMSAVQPAWAEDSGPGMAEVCQDAQGVHDAVMSQYPDAKFVPLTIWQQKEIEDYLNKMPPVSNDHFDHIIAVSAPKVPAVLLLIFTKPGCLRYEQEMDIRLFTGLIQGA